MSQTSEMIQSITIDEVKTFINKDSVKTSAFSVVGSGIWPRIKIRYKNKVRVISIKDWDSHAYLKSQFSIKPIMDAVLSILSIRDKGRIRAPEAMRAYGKLERKICMMIKRAIFKKAESKRYVSLRTSIERNHCLMAIRNCIKTQITNYPSSIKSVQANLLAKIWKEEVRLKLVQDITEI